MGVHQKLKKRSCCLLCLNVFLTFCFFFWSSYLIHIEVGSFFSSISFPCKYKHNILSVHLFLEKEKKKQKKTENSWFVEKRANNENGKQPTHAFKNKRKTSVLYSSILYSSSSTTIPSMVYTTTTLAWFIYLFLPPLSCICVFASQLTTLFRWTIN